MVLWLEVEVASEKWQRAAHIWGLVPCLPLDLERMFAHYYVPDIVLSYNIAALSFFVLSLWTEIQIC